MYEIRKQHAHVILRGVIVPSGFVPVVAVQKTPLQLRPAASVGQEVQVGDRRGIVVDSVIEIGLNDLCHT
jgi:hypothetical protein